LHEIIADERDHSLHFLSGRLLHFLSGRLKHFLSGRLKLHSIIL
jgi:hypothetical protein